MENHWDCDVNFISKILTATAFYCFFGLNVGLRKLVADETREKYRKFECLQVVGIEMSWW